MNEFAALLAEGARERGIPLGPAEIAAMEAHHRLLLHWNPATHLTTVTGAAEAADRHFLESLEALALVEDRPAELVDIGSGNGFPAVPLLVARPSLRARLLEPAMRKRAFLKELARELGLEGRIEVLAERVETPFDLARLGPFDYLSLRAVRGADALLPALPGALPPGGRALFFVGSAGLAAIRRNLPDHVSIARERLLPGREASFLLVLERG